MLSPLSNLQLKGLGIDAHTQQDPLIWNIHMQPLFQPVHQNDIEFENCQKDTFGQFKKKMKNRYKKIKKIRVFHVMKGKTKPSDTFLKRLFDILEVYFNLKIQHDTKAFTVTSQMKIKDPSSSIQYTVHHRNKQFRAVTLLSLFLQHKGQDEVTLGLINNRLHEGKNLVSGRAFGNGVTIVDSSDWKKSSGKIEIISTAVHELMHSIGLDHCTYWRCVMNPLSNDEIIMCPVCLKKFHHHAQFDIIERYQKLAKVLKSAGMIKGYKKCLQLIKTYSMSQSK